MRLASVFKALSTKTHFARKVKVEVNVLTERTFHAEQVNQKRDRNIIHTYMYIFTKSVFCLSCC